jgi:hypothetical protein
MGPPHRPTLLEGHQDQEGRGGGSPQPEQLFEEHGLVGAEGEGWPPARAVTSRFRGCSRSEGEKVEPVKDDGGRTEKADRGNHRPCGW